MNGEIGARSKESWDGEKERGDRSSAYGKGRRGGGERREAGGAGRRGVAVRGAWAAGSVAPCRALLLQISISLQMPTQLNPGTLKGPWGHLPSSTIEPWGSIVGVYCCWGLLLGSTAAAFSQQ